MTSLQVVQRQEQAGGTDPPTGSTGSSEQVQGYLTFKTGGQGIRMDAECNWCLGCQNSGWEKANDCMCQHMGVFRTGEVER